MRVSPNHVRYSRPPAKLHNRSIIPPHACQTSRLQLTAYRVDDNAIQLIVIRFFAHTGYFHACLPGDKGDKFPPHAHQTSCLWLAAYHVNDNAIWLIVIGFFTHTGYFHTCLPGDERDEFPPHTHQTSHLRLTAYRVDDNADSSLLDSLPTPGTSTPVSKGTRGTSFLHTLTKHHASDSLLIMLMIMLTHRHQILRPHQVLPRLSPRGRGGRVLHMLQLTAYHAVIRFFAHTGNFHTCLQGDEGDKFLVSPEKVLFLLSKSAISP